MRVEDDFITTNYRFKDDYCNPKHDVKIALNKQKDEDGSESFWITVYGEWGDRTVDQLDLTFKSKNECIKFINSLSTVIRQDYKQKEIR